MRIVEIFRRGQQPQTRAPQGSGRRDDAPAALANPPPVPRQAPVDPMFAGPRPTS
jgi:hypothetical protein